MKTIQLTADLGTVSASQEFEVSIDVTSQTFKLGYDNKPRYVYTLTEPIKVKNLNGTEAVIKTLPSKIIITNPKPIAKEWVIKNELGEIKSFITL